MGILEKLVEKFISQPERITINECIRLLNELGYKAKKKRGAECVFHRPSSRPINVPTPKKSKYMKSPYIKRIIKLLELEDYLEKRE